MYIPFSLGNKEFLLKPYTSKTEREILLLLSFEILDFERYFELFDFKSDYKIQDLSIEEQKTLLYKFREISVGDEIDVKFKCDKCKYSNENVLDANNFIILNKSDDSYIKNLSKKVTDLNIQEFIIDDHIILDDLDLEEYEKEKEKIENNQIQFNFIKETRCLKCGEYHKFNLGDSKYILEVLSDESLMTLYKAINFMTFYSHYTKEDIDKMMPFERTILMGLLIKTKEDLTQ